MLGKARPRGDHVPGEWGTPQGGTCHAPSGMGITEDAALQGLG